MQAWKKHIDDVRRPVLRFLERKGDPQIRPVGTGWGSSKASMVGKHFVDGLDRPLVLVGFENRPALADGCDLNPVDHRSIPLPDDLPCKDHWTRYVPR